MPLILSSTWQSDGNDIIAREDIIMNGNPKVSSQLPPLDTAVNGSPVHPPQRQRLSKDASYTESPTRDSATDAGDAFAHPASSDPSAPAAAPTGGLQVPKQEHRRSSPARFPTLPANFAPITAPSSDSPQRVNPPPLQHRHTLEVPRPPPSKEPQAPGTASSDDINLSNGRITTPTHKRRRTSLTFARLSPRTPTDPPTDGALAEDGQETEEKKHKRVSRRRRREDEDDDRVIVGTKVDQTHVNWVTAYDMLTGIRFTVSKTNAKPPKTLTDQNFLEANKYSFDVLGNQLTPSAKYDFKFKDYAPEVFRNLRDIFRLDPADYLVSLTSKYILSELGSPGKSGSFFYFSRDYKYIIKTIHHGEHKLLRKILPRYYAHVEKNPDTLLSQFYGLHRVKIPYGKKIHFVVMNNLFPPHRDIHRTFDLKGSTVGRDFREEDLEKHPRATLKDLNWLRRNLHLEFGPMKKHAFVEQMEKDVQLLKELKIMDYSLLVGIHDMQKGNEDNLREKQLRVFSPGADDESIEDPQSPQALQRTESHLDHVQKIKELRQNLKTQRPVPLGHSSSKMPDIAPEDNRGTLFYSEDGGFQATHQDDAPGEEIYYLGIIDCLTKYNFVKRSEHFLKGLSNPEAQISAIPPDRYGTRFVKFISGITVPKERQVGEEEKHAGPSSPDGPDWQLSTVEDGAGDAAATLPVVEEAPDGGGGGGGATTHGGSGEKGKERDGGR